MKIFRLAACLAFLTVPCLTSAQAPQTPGNATEKSSEAKLAEEALRDQVKKFYDLQVAGKPRAAESLVCEASKDDYYSMTKSSPRSAEVKKVTLAADLKSAKAVVLLEDELPIGLTKKLVKMAMPSDWKLEGGRWCYFLSPDIGPVNTPFGNMATKNDGSGKLGELPPSPLAAGADPSSLSSGVKFSKHELTLPYEVDGKDEIVISNGLSGPIQFRIGCPNVPGLACAVDQSYIPGGKKGTLSVDFKFKGTKIEEHAEVYLWILPFDAMTAFPIHRRPAQPAKP